MARRLDPNTLLVLGALAVGGYLVYRTINKVGDSLATFGGAIGSGLYDLFHKNQAGEQLHYTVKFPDGSQHAVPSGTVSADGIFSYGGKRYRLAIDKRIASGVNKQAFPI